MANAVRRLWRTLSEPRAAAALAISLYLVGVALAITLIFQHRADPVSRWLPPLVIIFGAVIGIAGAWIGRHDGRRIEMAGIVSLNGGLISGGIAEAEILTDLDPYLVALCLVAAILAVARWNQLDRWSHHRSSHS